MAFGGILFLSVRILQFPGEGGCAEDGGIGLLKLGEENLNLVLPDRKEVLVHCVEDRLIQELLAACQTAEEHDGLRGAEGNEVCELDRKSVV